MLGNHLRILIFHYLWLGEKQSRMKFRVNIALFRFLLSLLPYFYSPSGYCIKSPKPDSLEHALSRAKGIERINTLMNIKGKQTVESFHKRLGKIMWDKCGMARNAQGLQEAISEIQQLKKEFWSDVRIPGDINEMNPELDKANRVADFIELGELMCIDALQRNESCGGHFREEYQTPDGEAQRRDDEYMYVSAWELKGESSWELHKEELKYEEVKPSQRSYK